MTPTPGGRGPAGLLLSILLAHHNPALHVTVLEMGTSLDTSSRTTHYGQPVV
jgi:2-polyprenyl-6-methoxyphenol hydroxylase-like FAD-dependent oxidoreductase